MTINSDIKEILKEFKINQNEGTLCLLAYYFNLDPEHTCSEKVVKAINLTKIVEKNYSNGLLTWNVPLFQEQNIHWSWVESEYNIIWARRNYDRRDSNPDCVKRMQDFCAKYPQYGRKEIMKATTAYHTSVRDPQYLKSSAKFIFEGIGAMKKSMLLSWCEKTSSSEQSNHMTGKLM